MLEDPTFWVAVAFVIFVAAVGRKVVGAMNSALDARAKAIGAEIEEAEKLREEAQRLLAEYKRKQRDALSEAEEILDHAKLEAQRLTAQVEEDIEAALRRREQAALDKIAQAETKALQEVRNQAIDVAMAAAAKLLESNLDNEGLNTLVDDSIGNLSQKLN